MTGEETVSANERSLTVEAYVRPTQLLEPIDAKIETLRTLEREGVVDAVSVHGWPDEIALSERTPYSEAIDVFERVESWADRHGFSVRPPFGVRTVTSSITGDTRTVLTTPVMCLLIETKQGLASAFPHSRGADHYGVADAIASIRTGDVDLFVDTIGSTGRPPETCPGCESFLTNVQGIGVCHDCDRIETGTTTVDRSRGDRWSAARK